MTKTAKKPAAKTAAAQQRLTDEELVALMAKHLGKEPDASQLAVLKAIRALGKSVSGGRVRTLFDPARKAATKAPAGRKLRAKAAAAA
jgi:hypothetical protein